MSDPSTQSTPVAKVTAESVDPKYKQPFVDVNQLRDEPVPHRYVHGGFTGTNARFSFYFPLPEDYEGRFFQNTYPMALSEDIGPFPIAFDVATGNLGFTIASGAYYVQTNLGGADRMPPADPAVAAYRVNAAAAKYSRVLPSTCSVITAPTAISSAAAVALIKSSVPPRTRSGYGMGSCHTSSVRPTRSRACLPSVCMRFAY
jgi:hypothetical protein